MGGAVAEGKAFGAPEGLCCKEQDSTQSQQLAGMHQCPLLPPVRKSAAYRQEAVSGTKQPCVNPSLILSPQSSPPL